MIPAALLQAGGSDITYPRSEASLPQAGVTLALTDCLVS